MLMLASGIVTLAVGSQWISAEGPSQASPISTTITDQSPHSVEVTIHIPGINAQETQTTQGPYTRLTAEGAGVTTTIGSPELPVVRFTLWIPEGGHPVIEILSKKTVEIPLASRGITSPIYPVQPPVEKLPGARENAQFQIDVDVYAADSWQMTELAALSDPGYLRGYRMVDVTVNPVDYNPARNTLRITNNLTVKVSVPNADLEATETAHARYHSPPYWRMAQSVFLNGNELDDIPDLEIGYLVICDPIYEYNTDLQDFLDWKHAQGYHTTLVTTNTTGPTNTQIKNYIQTAYNTWTVPPTYVLLIADTDIIPHWVGSGTGTPATDLNYACLSGIDYFADIYLGRWSVITPTQLGNIVNKTLNFEKVLWTGNDTWEKYATFMASADNYTVSEGTHNYVINNYLNPLGYQYDRLYCVTYGATTQQVRDALNAGRSLFIYSGHGAVTYWADGPVFYQSDVRASVNTVYPVVNSFACVTGQFTADECFGETWIRDDHASVIFWGSSVNSYWTEDDILEKRLYQGMFDNQTPGDTYNLTWVGGMFDYAKLKYYEYFGAGGMTQRYFEMYNIMGEPSLDIWTNIPVELNATHSTTVMVGDSTFSVSVTNVPTWALVCARTENADNLLATAYLQGSDSVNLEFSSLTMPGTMYLTISGHDIEPYFAQVQIITSGPDIWPPLIAHTPLGTTLDETGPYVVDATINDYSGVADATLYHSTNGVTFTPVAMTNPSGNDWTGNIPGSPAGTTVSYYIEATDASPQSNVGQTDTYSFDVLGVLFSDDMEAGQGYWTHSAVSSGWTDQWHLSTENSHSSSHAWKFGDTGTGNYADHADGGLVTPSVAIQDDAELTFWHWIAAEISGAYPDSAYDGGIVDISVDSGPWQQLTLSPGYNKTIRYSAGGGAPYSGPFAGGTPCFSDSIAWQQETADLSTFTGDIQLRFRFGSDNSGGAEGWYVDDIQIIGTPGSMPLVPITDLVIAMIGDNVRLSWTYPYSINFNVYSDIDPDGAFTTLEITTSTTSVVLHGAAIGVAKKFYIVRATDQ